MKPKANSRRAVVVRDLPFPKSLSDFVRLFPDDAACAAYLEKIHWRKGFVCPHCAAKGEPYRFEGKVGRLRCRECTKDVWLMAGTAMERSHVPLLSWFRGAYLVASMTQGVSAVQLQRQLGLSRYETAFQVLHRLRAGMVNRDRIGAGSQHVEIAGTRIGGDARVSGRTVPGAVEVVGALESLRKKPKKLGGIAAPCRGRLHAGRLRLGVIGSRDASDVTSFIEASIEPGTRMVGPAYEGSEDAEPGDRLELIHVVLSSLRTWISGVHRAVDPKRLPAYLDEFAFRFNRRFYPPNAFQSLLGTSNATRHRG